MEKESAFLMDTILKRLHEAEETIDAIRSNKIDALLITTDEGEQVYTLKDVRDIYSELLEKINEGAVTLADDDSIVYANKKFAEMLNVPEVVLAGSSIFKWIALTDLNKFMEFIRRNEEEEIIEINLLNGRESTTPVAFKLSRLNLNADPKKLFCLIATNLTEQNRQKEIYDSEKLSRSIIEQTPEAIVVCDTEYKIIRASIGAEKLAGRHLLHQNFSDVFPFEDKENKEVVLPDLLALSLPVQTDVRFSRNDGGLFNLVFNAGALWDTEEKLLGYIFTLTNITPLVVARDKISASLKEKTTLLKEIHHRVKNNLQVVSSLLNIHASYVKESSVRNIFHECQRRISSMALIHQKLYQSNSLSEVNIADYITDMTGYLCSTYFFNSNKVVFNFPEYNVPVHIESAIPLGLILNELISNSFKHGLKDKEKGELVISLSINDKAEICISVKDNGNGIPEYVDVKKTESLGLQLVHTLIDQLRGEIELVRGNGCEFLVKFPAAV